MRGRKPDPARARRGTGHRPVPVPLAAASGDMGDVPEELTADGRELWIDAVAFLEKNGRANRVYRHGLRLLCRAYEAAMARDASGVKALEATRRWLSELQLTPAASAKGGMSSDDDANETGPAKLLRLVSGKAK